MSHTNHSAKLSFQAFETIRGVGNEVVGGEKGGRRKVKRGRRKEEGLGSRKEGVGRMEEGRGRRCRFWKSLRADYNNESSEVWPKAKLIHEQTIMYK